MSVKKLIKIADVGYGTFYNHFDSIEDIQFEALNKTIRNTLIDFKLGCDQRKRLCIHHIFGFVASFEFVIEFSFDKVVVGRYSNGCSSL